MDELQKILLQHAETYPLMRPADAVKLLYQNEFGSGHFVTDEASSLRWLSDEGKKTPAALSAPESIGNQLVRLHLGDINARALPYLSVCRMFMHTANTHIGTMAVFFQKLQVLISMTAADKMPFHTDDLSVYLKAYQKAGYPAVSHSAPYCAAYVPAYRIIDERYVRLLPVIETVDALRQTRENIVIAIDGRCASGKTTAAALLSPLWNAPVIHMDDFFLPPALRTPARYAEPGGTIHYERFAEEILPHLVSHDGFSYRRFDCVSLTYTDTVTIPASPVLIIEGSYSLHATFGNYADVTVFCDIEKSSQLSRLQARNTAYVQPFLEKWIPLEELYFSTFQLPTRCTHIIK